MSAWMRSLLLGVIGALGVAGLPAFAEPDLDLLNLRDPFKMPQIVVESMVPRTELEAFPIHEFSMQGVVSGPGEVKAMLKGPNGKTYFVSHNQPIGTRGGRVTAITAQSIEVKERIVNVLGQQEEVKTTIQLPSDAKSTMASGINSGW